MLYITEDTYFIRGEQHGRKAHIKIAEPYCPTPSWNQGRALKRVAQMRISAGIFY
jgi:hypothetical protein